MVLWFLLALMTGAAVLTVILPLSFRRGGAAANGDIPFYRAQVDEIARDLARGTIGDAEAASARAEAGRRLLRATSEQQEPIDVASEPALRRRRAAAALGLSVIPIVALAVYGALGSPHLATPSPPAATAGGEDRARQFAEALAKIEAHLDANPADARGWDLVAPLYLRMGRIEDAAKAFAQARQAGGDTAERLLGFAEATVMAAGGMVSAEARSAFAKGVELDPASARGRFYLALASEQDGDKDAASESYRSLLAGAPPGAPWVPMVRNRLAALDGSASSQPDIAPESVTPDMISAMVEGLDARLGVSGGTEAEWGRLVRSFVVLGRRDDARERLGRAKTAFASDEAARARLDRLAGDLGLMDQGQR